MRADKREWENGLAREAEAAVKKRNLKGLYNVTKPLCNDQPDHGGKLLTEEEIRTRWHEQFGKVLNRPDPEIQAAISDEQQNELDFSDKRITRQEIKAVLKNMKNGNRTMN